MSRSVTIDRSHNASNRASFSKTHGQSQLHIDRPEFECLGVRLHPRPPLTLRHNPSDVEEIKPRWPHGDVCTLNSIARGTDSNVPILVRRSACSTRRVHQSSLASRPDGKPDSSTKRNPWKREFGFSTESFAELEQRCTESVDFSAHIHDNILRVYRAVGVSISRPKTKSTVLNWSFSDRGIDSFVEPIPENQVSVQD